MSFLSQFRWLVTIFILSTCFTHQASSQDTTPPSIRCKTGLVIVLPTNGEIVVDAIEFDDGTLDDFTPQEEIQFFLDGSPSKTSYRVTCDTFEKAGVLGEFRKSFYLHARDNAGNTSVCEVELIVQDNKYVCGQPFISCEGCIISAQTGNIVEALLNCSTDTVACYDVLLDQPKSISFCRNWDHLNGVSAADLVAIQRHLLGLEVFTESYQAIAADVTNSQSVSAADISGIRQLILGVIPDFSRYGIDSWIITNQGIGVLNFDNIDQCPDSTDFIAVKMGDVTGDAAGLSDNNTRSNLQLEYSWSQLDNNEYFLQVYTKSKIDLSALQLSIEISGNIISMEPGAIDVSDESFAIHNEKVQLVWYDERGVGREIKGGEMLFRIKISNNTGLVEVACSGLAFNSALNEFQIRMQKEEDTFDCYPNPCESGSVLNIISPLNDQLKLIDVSGQIIAEWHVLEGNNSVTMGEINLKPGTYFVYSSTGRHMKKLIITNK